MDIVDADGEAEVDSTPEKVTDFLDDAGVMIGSGLKPASSRMNFRMPGGMRVSGSLSGDAPPSGILKNGIKKTDRNDAMTTVGGCFELTP